MPRSSVSLRLFLATLLLAALPVLGGWWAWSGHGPLQQEATVLVKRGTSINQMAEQLERDGVIRSASLFKLWARARKLQLIRGEYTFTSQASLADVAGKLHRAEIHYTPVAIPEGSHAWSVQKRLRDFVPEDIFWTLWNSPRLARTAGFEEAESLEGLVAPATYKLHHAMEPEEVMLMLVEAFRHQVRPKLEGGVLPPYETLILASLVEKETRLPEEQPLVAGVYKRRLDIGMRLQCDPTSLYARWLEGDLRFTAPLVADIHRYHRFNTYAVGGLPPTPIAIPSPGAIEAAKAPAEGKDLYFVANGLGGHSFAPSLSDHNRNVGVYRQEILRQKKAARGKELKATPDDAAMKPAGMHRKEGPAGQRGSLFKGPDAAGRPAGFIPSGEGWRASPCCVRLVSRSTRYATTRLPRLARPAPLARRRGVLP